MLTRFAVIENRREGGLWWRIPLVLFIWGLLITPLIATVVVVKTVRGYVADLPDVPELGEWRTRITQSTIVKAADGSILAVLPFTDGELIGHRFWTSFDELPPLLIKAILAAEDERFFWHKGVDPRAVIRAAVKNYEAGEVVEGASTITQQLARNLLPEEIGDERSARRKVREALMAYRIEKRYSKQEVFETYVNLVFLGSQSYGVKAAARAYFNAELDELTPAQAALIAGLAQAPGRADPAIDIEAARARRDEVLDRMLETKVISADEHSGAKAQPIELSPPPKFYGTSAPWHTERVRQILEAEYTEQYHRGGLVVETTAETALSLLSAEAVAKRARSFRSKEKTAQAAAIVIDHTNHYVEALVGGRSFDESVFDRALQACRQPGSAFKPLLYGAALERDAITPGTALRDGPIAEWDEDLEIHWKPQNSGRTFRGVAIAQDALASSLNSPAVDVLDRVGGKAVIEFARRLGISTKMVNVRPLALGSSCVIPYELTRAVATIANGGVAVEPTLIKTISAGGEVIFDRRASTDAMLPAAGRLDALARVAGLADEDSVIDEETAFMLKSMMRAVVSRGTATTARDIGRPAAGKTGTTNDNSDAWFVGFTGRIVSSVWVGYDNPAIKLPSSADGARGALPLWKSIVRTAEGRRKPVPVPGKAPGGLVAATIDRETGLLAEPGAGGALGLMFRRGTVPTTTSGSRPDMPGSLERTTRDF